MTDDFKTYTCHFCTEEFTNPLEFLKHLDMEHDTISSSWRNMNEEDAERHITMLGI